MRIKTSKLVILYIESVTLSSESSKRIEIKVRNESFYLFKKINK